MDTNAMLILLRRALWLAFDAEAQHRAGAGCAQFEPEGAEIAEWKKMVSKG